MVADAGRVQQLTVGATVRPASMGEWRRAHDLDDHATFFDGPAWSELWETCSDGSARPRPLRLSFDDGREAILGITRMPSRIPGVMRDQLSPEGNCGGWVTPDVLDVRHLRALIDVIFGSASCIWRIGPTRRRVQQLAEANCRRELTHVIELADGLDAARSRWHGAARRSAAVARRRGARLVQATTRRQWEAYTGLYRATISRWDKPLFTYDERLFDELPRLSDRGVQLWLVEADGRPCAGAVVVLHRQHAVWWHGASAPERCHGAANLLQWDLLEELVTAGVRTYDLNGSGPLPGVVRFKESLGASAQPVLAYERRHPLERAASNVKQFLGR